MVADPRSQSKLAPSAQCLVPGCGRRRRARGLCRPHDHQARTRALNLAALDALAPPPPAQGCAVPGCVQRGGGRSGLCTGHGWLASNLYGTGVGLTAEQLARLASTRQMGKHRGCSVAGCPRRHAARGYCRVHYKRGPPRPPGEARLSDEPCAGGQSGREQLGAHQQPGAWPPCPVPGCGRRSPRALCGLHWRWAVQLRLNPEELTAAQLEAVAAYPLRTPCRVPRCGAEGRGGLCPPHRGRANRLAMALANLTGAELERLAYPVSTGLARLPPDPLPPPLEARPCRQRGCGRPGIAQGLCTRHYLRRERG